MNRLKILIAGIVIVGLLALLVYLLVMYLKPKGAGILVDAVPKSLVLIDGAQVGTTPYEVVRDAGEIVIKIEPTEEANEPFSPYETKINLVSGVKTVIRYDFGENPDFSQGETLSFEKIGAKETELAIVTIPNVAQISVDNIIRGFAPFKTSSITPGEHALDIVAEGYLKRSIKAKTIRGYKLIAVVKLAQDSNFKPVSTSTPTPVLDEPKVFIEILDTPTGFLRVRSQPSTAASEIGQVSPGESYPFIAQDETSGWYKIEYKPGIEGWITEEYAKKVAEPVSSPFPSATPKPTPTPDG